MLRASVMSFFPTRYADEMNCLHNVVHKTVISGVFSILFLSPGLLIFRGKKSKISRDFQGQIRGKIGRFRGENKSKFAKK